MPPKYSPAALFGTSFLFRKFNDIDVYIEDTTNRALMEGLVDRILQGRARVTRLHQLGGKDMVIDRCAQDQSDTRRRLYIIDGDLDILAGVPIPPLNYLYRLKVYCSENLLLCKEGLVKLAYEDATNRQRKQIETQLKLEDLLNEVEKRLLPLFLVYAIAHKLACGVETVSYGLFKLLDKLVFDKKRISARYVQVKRQIISTRSLADYRAARDEVKRNIEAYNGNRYHLVCAKTITLRLIFERCKAKFGTKCTYDQLKARLSATARTDIDSGFRSALLKA